MPQSALQHADIFWQDVCQHSSANKFNVLREVDSLKTTAQGNREGGKHWQNAEFHQEKCTALRHLSTVTIWRKWRGEICFAITIVDM